MAERKKNKNKKRRRGGKNEEKAAVIDELNSIEERYIGEKLIATGGMKKIFSVYDNVTEKTVAKGVILDKQNHEIVERFVNEVRIGASLEHPNILPVYDLGLTEDNDPYFTMKLMNGKEK